MYKHTQNLLLLNMEFIYLLSTVHTCTPCYSLVLNERGYNTLYIIFFEIGICSFVDTSKDAYTVL